ncbi:MAG: CvpA family protein [Bacteroidetes bacterium]|nr:MAG: CvpA family protein [Bacteroidota bacterium]
MNFIDIIIIIPLLWFTYKGFTKGLIIELATLIALLLGIYIAAHFSNYTADFLMDKLDFHSEYMSIISFAITFVLVVVLVMLFGKSLEKVINILLLSFVNKMAGAAFGLIKVAFVISVLIMIMGNMSLEEKIITKELKEGSLLYEPIKKIAPVVFPVIEENKGKILKKLEAE